MRFKFLEFRPLWGQKIYSGVGYIGGDLPSDPNPSSPDGRTKVAGVPKSVLIILRDGVSRRALETTRSKEDGTWKFSGLALNYRFAVEFVNDAYKNSAGVHYNSLIQDWVFAKDPTT